MNDMVSKEIIVKAAGGDLAAFEEIYKAASGFVYNVALGVVHNGHDAEEITQEVFLNVYHKLKGFRLESSLKTWVYRMAANTAINRYNKMKKDRQRNREYHSGLEEWHEPKEPDIDADMRKKAVKAYLDGLDPDQKACVVLREVEGLSYEEIADVLKVKVNTVRTRIKRAREKLLAMAKGGVGNELR
jgi:RNA polymerase sigma-70 factor (ECF subfamily)